MADIPGAISFPFFFGVLLVTPVARKSPPSAFAVHHLSRPFIGNLLPCAGAAVCGWEGLQREQLIYPFLVHSYACGTFGTVRQSETRGGTQRHLPYVDPF